MLRNTNPKNARSKRILQNREAKATENTKTAIFLKGSKTSATINTLLKDFSALKKPFSNFYSKKNAIHPFEDDSSLEFLCKKNDASLFMVGSHSKKRPNNLIIGRMFDHEVMDMIEVGVSNFKGMEEFKNMKAAVGSKPLFVFNGEQFEQKEEYSIFRNLILDFFRGTVVDKVCLSGLETLISVTADKNNLYLRTFRIVLLKSGTRLPRVELEEIGPSMDLKVGRTKFAAENVVKESLRVPSHKKPKKKKNITGSVLGTFGRVHTGKQDLSQLQTRKMKGLKRSPEEAETEKKARSE